MEGRDNQTPNVEYRKDNTLHVSYLGHVSRIGSERPGLINNDTLPMRKTRVKPSPGVHFHESD